jgi:hypothetical protein
LPLANAALIVLLIDDPTKTERLPGLLRVKSKPVVFENQALASELGFALFLKALAFSRASVETVMGPEYFLDDFVGDEPSVV